MKKSILVMKSFVLAGALFFVSCNDDDGITCPEAITGELNETETAFAGTWALSAIEAEDAIDLTDDNEDNPSEDLFVQYSECDRDLVYTFLIDRKYISKLGFTAEGCTSQQNFVGTWGLTSENKLMLVANCSSEIVNIETSDSSEEFSYQVTVTYNDASGALKTTKATYTFTKQAEEVTPE